MSLFHAVGLIITLVALFGYLNSRFIGLPDVIGITAIGLVVSVAVAIVGSHSAAVAHWAQKTVAGIDFSKVVFQGMLGMLLFAGTLHVDFSDIRHEKWIILFLATVGVTLSEAWSGPVSMSARTCWVSGCR
ncbi:MAG: cation:proton antiporter [Salinisphaera sp.]|jgi:CPA1 family monovalent cation:H+ antiporter|nr:cation:proton antiporter [Salinisphaera sp.]